MEAVDLWVVRNSKYIGIFLLVAQVLQRLQKEDMPYCLDSSPRVEQVSLCRRKGISGLLSLRVGQVWQIAGQKMMRLLAGFSHPFGLELP